MALYGTTGGTYSERVFRPVMVATPPQSSAPPEINVSFLWLLVHPKSSNPPKVVTPLKVETPLKVATHPESSNLLKAAIPPLESSKTKLFKLYTVYF